MTSGVAEVIGTVLENRYRVDAVLASGGMSTVYAGLDLRLQRPIAIKIMDPRLADDPSFLRRFELEARSAARLHHPNVVAVHDQGVDHRSGHVYLTMELVEGGTLRELMDATGPLDPALALTVAEPVAAALAAAHHAGLVHRDVKPENVLIGRDGTVKVADFGLVRAATGSVASTGNVILGTVAYLSPEQVATGGADPRSDVYALGVVLFEMLTGRQPYVGDTALSVAYQHVNSDVPAPGEIRPDLAPALDNVVLLATRRNPETRPHDGASFLSSLRQVRSGLDLPIVPVPVPQPRPGVPVDDDATPVIAPAGPSGTRALSRQVAAPAPATHTALYQQDRKRSRKWLVFALVGVLLLAVTLGVGGWWLGSGRWTSVPSVAGLDAKTAQRTLQDADLTVHVTNARDDAVAKGKVIGTDPAAGAQALRGDEITMKVSTGRPVVPQIAPGTSAADADSAIKSAGLTPARDGAKDRYDAKIPAGRVLAVSPSPGTAVRGNGTVTVILSKGPAPKPVPTVVGKSHDAAFDELRSAGLEPYDLPARFSPSASKGTVVATTPAGGTTVPGTGSPRVGVAVSNAVTVPDVEGRSVAQAKARLSALGLKVSVRQLFDRPESRVVEQSIDDGDRVKAGTEIVLTAFP